MQTNRGAPTPPIAFAGDAAGVRNHVEGSRVEVSAALRDELAATGAEVSVAAAEIGEASRDWWPLAMIWALEDQVTARAAAIVRPHSAAEVAAVLRLCNDAGVPVTAAAGRSGVCGASVPVFGGVLLDLTAMEGIVDVDKTSMLVNVLPGTFGDVFEDTLRDEHGVTCGHWPQSMALSTVGGWVACRGAGQLSTRYGKIEDIVTGLDVVLADGTLVTTGGAPRAAVGPDLTQLFVGSEGTLGIIVGARLRLHPVPPAEMRAAFAFASFTEALDTMRRIVQRGATPAVLRLYDPIEGDRNFKTGDANVLLALDEGDAHIVEATRRIVDEECSTGGPLDVGLVEQWMGHRNDVSALEALISRGFVVDTMEIAASWRALPDVYERATAAILAVEHTMVASAHQSHSYTDGGCLYFTFAGKPPEGERESYYRAAWDAGQRAVLAAGGALSHHHGIGLNRGRFVADALGAGFGVLQSVKDALDPNGILNPGKLGLAGPFGAVPWP
ncbi:MAG: alkyldihydroxyacetonephosphate synthase [Actinomycetota bacterium]|nr:alkyldihydroxyacetonephosphate synthase [Actinomycetota bacterium]